MAWSQGSGDYLLRRFLGDHFDGPLDEVLSPGRQQEQEISNPNLEDLPPEPRGSGVTRAQEGNVFWSERANTEHVLRQMRPEHLPPLDASVSIQGSERGRASHSLSDPPFGAEEWLQTAREMDRQTSIGHLRTSGHSVLARQCRDWPTRAGVFLHGRSGHTGGTVVAQAR